MRYTINASEIKFRDEWLLDQLKGCSFEVEVAHTGKALCDPHGKAVTVRFQGKIPNNVDREEVMHRIVNVLIDDSTYVLHYRPVKEERIGFSFYKIVHEFLVTRKEVTL